MKKKLTLIAISLFLIVGFNACKKQDDETAPLRSKMLGKWQVNKVEVTTYNAEGLPVTVTTNYTSADYVDFKDNENDDVEFSLGTNNRTLGTFSSSTDHTFYLDFAAKDLTCTANVITENQFQFSGNKVGANPRVVETYYLSR